MWSQIEKFLETYNFITNANVRALFGISAPTANWILAGLFKEGKPFKRRGDRQLVYKEE